MFAEITLLNNVSEAIMYVN